MKRLRPVNDGFYGELGADPAALQVHYDLEPRASKDPVAFTTFGRRPRTDGHAVIPGEPWVFASYQIGGLENLLEHAEVINKPKLHLAFHEKVAHCRANPDALKEADWAGLSAILQEIFRAFDLQRRLRLMPTVQCLL